MLSQLKEYAKVLSESIKLVRIDFYIVDGKVFLGEMTFAPGAGLLPSADQVFELPHYRAHLRDMC